MEIQTDKTAYYFPTISDLERFVEIFSDKIYRPDLVLKIYQSSKDDTFDFYEPDEWDEDEENRDYVYDWDHCHVGWYREWGYKIIVFGHQRTE